MDVDKSTEGSNEEITSYLLVFIGLKIYETLENIFESLVIGSKGLETWNSSNVGS